MFRKECIISTGTLMAIVQAGLLTVIERGELSGKGEVGRDRDGESP
jgi:hypothetical protein